MKYINFNKLSAISTFIIASLFSFSSVAELLALEGEITSITGNPDGSATMVVMGVSVNVPSTALISSPTGPLTMGQLIDATPLPGRPGLPGFEGGTAIVLGQALATGNTAEDLFVEPAENLLSGVKSPCTTSTCSEISISGIPMIRLTDPRIAAPFNAVNAIGLPIILSTVLEGTAAAGEGYLGLDGNFYYFLLEAEGDLLESTAGRGVTPPPIVSITRALCRDEKDYRIDGGISVEAGEVELYLGDNPVATATADITPDVNGQGTYQFRDSISVNCATTVTVKYHYDTSSVVQTTEAMNIR